MNCSQPAPWMETKNDCDLTKKKKSELTSLESRYPFIAIRNILYDRKRNYRFDH